MKNRPHWSYSGGCSSGTCQDSGRDGGSGVGVGGLVIVVS